MHTQRKSPSPELRLNRRPLVFEFKQTMTSTHTDTQIPLPLTPWFQNGVSVPFQSPPSREWWDKALIRFWRCSNYHCSYLNVDLPGVYLCQMCGNPRLKEQDTKKVKFFSKKKKKSHFIIRIQMMCNI